MSMLSRRATLAGLSSSLAIFSTSHMAVAQAPTRELKTLLDGGFALPPASLSAGRDQAEVAQLLAAAGMDASKPTTVLNVTALKQGDKTILIDCGSGKDFVPGTGKLADALQAAGIDPDTVTDVIFTHAHPDHLWGALDDFGTPAYPKAKYHIPAPEMDDWFADDIYKRLPEDRHAFAAGAQRILKELAPVLSRFTPGQEPVSGVQSVASPGHTRGHCCFLTQTDKGPTLILGDAATHPVISFQRPDWAGGFDADPETAARTRKQLLGRAVADKLTIVGYHFPNGGIGRVEALGAAFRFVA
jgi:glyoxylase-like metal-dependent hydrolase (beta-lactamase superfamily II)